MLHPADRPIYLDYNATTPIDPAVALAMRPFLEGAIGGGFGNPSSTHSYGVEAKKAVESARSEVATLLGAQASEIIFTSGGSEANNLAIKGIAFARRDRGRHIISTAVEHPAVLEVLAWLEKQGFSSTLIPVDSLGRVDPADFEAAIRPDTILLSVMHANNEVGTIQAVRALADIAHRAGLVVHCDAAQSVGKIPVNCDDLGIDLLSIAGHKLYAPKGIGALYVRTGIELDRLVHGAAHESGRRAGTENLLCIAGLGAACTLAGRELATRSGHYRELRDLLESLILTALPEAIVNGDRDSRLPNTLSISFPGVDAGALLSALPGVAASAGAACHADRVEMSHVLAAMGVPPRQAMGTLRFSTGAFLSKSEVESAAAQVIAAVRRLAGAASPALGSATGPIRLTEHTKGLGCACKIGPRTLEKILAGLPKVTDPAVLVGAETSDDAAVYRISDEFAIVGTLDFFTPIVDDPWTFGAIAAANALSDIWAMGGVPLFALNIVAFPVGGLPLSVLEEILRGASDKATEAGVSVIGGHSIDDTEPKFGMSVTGRVDPRRLWKNSGARAGDVLVLTKPIGTGVITTAMKRGAAAADTAARAIEVMTMLNGPAARILAGYDVGSVTDVTGFGLMGHLREMSRGSGMDMELVASTVPLIPGALALVREGMVSGGSKANEELVGDVADWAPSLPADLKTLLCDAQTSGGLLASVAAGQAQALVKALRGSGCAEAAVVGRVLAPGAGRISVR